MKMPLEELAERYSVFVEDICGVDPTSIGIGKGHQAQEDGADHAIWRRRMELRAYIKKLGKQEN